LYDTKQGIIAMIHGAMIQGIDQAMKDKALNLLD